MTISVAFMIPLGISQAANVRVGHAVGARDPAAARRAGIAAIVLGGGAEIAFAALSLFAPAQVVGLFLARRRRPRRRRIALLRVAACSSSPTASRCVAAGALRGLGDTRTPFLLAAFGYWAVGFPAAWFLTLHTGLGAGRRLVGPRRRADHRGDPADRALPDADRASAALMRRLPISMHAPHTRSRPARTKRASGPIRARPSPCRPAAQIQIIHRGITVADSRNCVRTLETSHPPSYYIPRADIDAGGAAPLRPPLDVRVEGCGELFRRR